ncbi:ganglioside-induced differentiation-associated protein 1-like [Babylonia areolata]|uniref:ganglioside-induced differentiation-associated protein 1-like n=1 Tax=Babylonia areolata TaxID=304850 RepID=UPI003FD2716B
MSAQGDSAAAADAKSSTTCTREKKGKENGHEIKLYYFPTSFSSQKVLLAAYEKGVQFQPRLVSLFHGQHMEPWYVKLNPEGTHVPVLVHGNIILNNPEEIIDYIDSLETAESSVHLVPDVTTQVGQSVAAVREQLNQVPVDILTYGVVFHPHLAPSPCQLPTAVQRSMRENFARRLQYLTHKATLHPDLRDGYLSKSQIAAQKYDIITDEEKVKGQLGQLDSLFQGMEKMLAAVHTEEGGEAWLFGEAFTAADITFSVLLRRLTLLGLQGRLFPPDTCPNTHRYLRQLARRPAFQRIQQEVGALRMTLLWEDVKAASPLLLAAAGVGLAAGLAFFLARRLH